MAMGGVQQKSISCKVCHQVLNIFASSIAVYHRLEQRLFCMLSTSRANFRRRHREQRFSAFDSHGRKTAITMPACSTGLIYSPLQYVPVMCAGTLRRCVVLHWTFLWKAVVVIDSALCDNTMGTRSRYVGEELALCTMPGVFWIGGQLHK